MQDKRKIKEIYNCISISSNEELYPLQKWYNQLIEKTIKKDLSESRESFSAIFVLGQAHLRQSDLKTAKMAEKI